MCQIFTLLLIYSHCFIINPVIDAHMLLPLLIFANSHYIWPPHTLSPLNYYGSHGSKLCPPQLLWIPWLHTLSPSMTMYTMSLHSVPLNDDGSQLLWIPWLPPICPPSMIMAPSWWILGDELVASAQMDDWLGWKMTVRNTWEDSV